MSDNIKHICNNIGDRQLECLGVSGNDAGTAVKSAERVFEVLEWFRFKQMPLNAITIARELGYPQSSSIALLKSMVAGGYLSFDRSNRTYFPTIRVALLGGWIDKSLYGAGGLMPMAQAMADASGEMVTLSCQNDMKMQFMQVVPGRNVAKFKPTAGECAPLFQSTIGLVALSRKDDGEIKKLVRRHNAWSRGEGNEQDHQVLLDQIRMIRRFGYGVGYETYIPDIGAIAWPLQPEQGAPPVVVAIGGPSQRLRERAAEIVHIGHQIINHYSVPGAHAH